MNRPVRTSGSTVDTTSLRHLVRDIPLATERALVELVSDTAAIATMNSARGREPFFRRLIGAVTGRDRRNQVEITSRLLGRQRGLEAWVRELAARDAVTDLAIAQMAGHVRALQHQLAEVGMVAGQALTEVRELAGIVAELARAIDAKLTEHEGRLDDHDDRLAALEHRVRLSEARQAAWEAFDRSVRRWEARSAYGSLPSVYQVALLVREVATGPCGVHEFVSGDDGWRDRLAERILADPRLIDWVEPVGLDGLLDEAWRAVSSTDRRSMLAELLGAGLPSDLRIPDGPLTAALRDTMEYAARPPEIRPAEPATVAVTGAMRTAGHLPTTYTAGAMVRLLIAEQADGGQEALARLRRRSPDGVADG